MPVRLERPEDTEKLDICADYMRSACSAMLANGATTEHITTILIRILAATTKSMGISREDLVDAVGAIYDDLAEIAKKPTRTSN